MPPTAEVHAENKLLKRENQQLQELVATLRTQVAWMKNQLFGPGKNEKLDRAQLLLQIEQTEAVLARAERQQISYERRAEPNPRTPPAETFKNLPVKETIVLIPTEVQRDPDLYEEIGAETSFEVDITPPTLYKREFIRKKYRHRLDRFRPPVVAPALPRASGSYAAPGLMAWVLIAKYVQHLPLYRQEKMAQKWGASLSRQVMCDWVERAAWWLKPIYEKMGESLRKGNYLQADETPVRCQDPDVPGKTALGWLWVLSRPQSDVVFSWRLSRRHAEVDTLLQGFRGLLQADGYPAYTEFAAEHPGVIRLGCWAHARRGFVEALPTSPKEAGYLLRLIAGLYSQEKQWDAAKIGADLRTARRQSELGLTFKLIFKVAQYYRRKARPKSPLGEACSYLLNQWPTLAAHLQHGQTRLDNNLIENAIRPSALGKKNWLFIGHPDAGERSAIIYSIVISCERRGIDPLTYLTDVLTRLPRMTNQEDLTVLTPAKWQSLPVRPVTPPRPSQTNPHSPLT